MPRSATDHRLTSMTIENPNPALANWEVTSNKPFAEGEKRTWRRANHLSHSCSAMSFGQQEWRRLAAAAAAAALGHATDG